MKKKMEPQNDKPNDRKETLLELFQRCPIDAETWKFILERPNDQPREVSFDDWQFDDDDLTAVAEIID